MRRYQFRATLLIWLVLSFTAWNSLKLWTLVDWQNTIIEFSAQPGLVIAITSSVIWITAGVILIWGIWQNKFWIGKALIKVGIGYTIWYWTERLLWQAPRPNWLFAVIVNLTLIIIVLFTTRSLIRETHERKSSNTKIE